VFIYGIGFEWRTYFLALGAEVRETGEAPVKLTGEAGLVAQEDGERGRLFGEFAEGECGTHGFVRRLMGCFELRRHGIHLVVNERGFHGPGALQAPADDGHFMDGEVFGGGDGGVLEGEGFVEQGEFFVAFVA
jgi:hypothetical protein